MYRQPIEPLESRTLFSAYVVNTLDDSTAVDGLISLREAITAANTNAAFGDAAAGEVAGDSITFASSLNNGTIVLTQGQLLISGGIDINGQGHNVTLDGNAASRVFEINTADAVSIANLTIANGLSDIGGGIYLSGGAGTTTLDGLLIRDNTASSLGGGGVANVDHTLTIRSSTLSGNVAFDLTDGDGGGVLLLGGTTTVFASLLSANYAQSSGGGLSNIGATVTIDRSTIELNAVFGPDVLGGGGGGGLANFGTMLISGSLIRGNSVVDSPERSGGGVYSSGFTTITASRVNENGIYGGGDGGGIASVIANLNVFESRILRNRASGTDAEGGGIAVLGASTVLVDGSLMEQNRGYRGGAVSAPVGNLTFNASFLFNNWAKGAVNGNGGAIYANGASVRVLGSDVRNNRAAGAAGGILVSGALEVRDSRIDFNIAGGTGGGIFVSNTNWTVDNSSISYNSSGIGDNQGGGGITTFGGVGTIINAAIFGNQTLGSGGGIFNAGILSLTTADISRNFARLTGGGVFNDAFNNATLTQDDSTFIFRNYPNNVAGISTV